jgi:hypothetical protein
VIELAVPAGTDEWWACRFGRATGSLSADSVPGEFPMEWSR